MNKKLFPLLLIIGGALLLLNSFWSLWSVSSTQKAALEEAKKVLESSEESITQFVEDTNGEPLQTPIGIIPSSENEVDASEATEPTVSFHAEIGEVIGVLKIPRLKQELPIIHGVGDEELNKGVGHYPGTAFPGENDQVVLSGHRDTVFQELGQLDVGDEFIIELPYGNFEYIFTDVQIVDADDRTVIVSTAPNEVLLLTTCYPFRYVGNAPQRYIIHAIPKELF